MSYGRSVRVSVTAGFGQGIPLRPGRTFAPRRTDVRANYRGDRQILRRRYLPFTRHHVYRAPSAPHQKGTHHHEVVRVGGPGLHDLLGSHGGEEAWAASPIYPLPVHQHPLRQGHTEEGIHRRGDFSGVPGVRQRTRDSPTYPEYSNEVGVTPNMISTSSSRRAGRDLWKSAFFLPLYTNVLEGVFSELQLWVAE